jgi:hypothetical protein
MSTGTSSFTLKFSTETGRKLLLVFTMVYLFSLRNTFMTVVTMTALFTMSEAGRLKCRPTSTTTTTAPTETAAVCSLGTCLTGFELCGGSGGLFCGCATTAESAGFCAEDAGCEESLDCATSEDCPGGSRCVVATCCGVPKCLPACSNPGPVLAAAVSGASGGRRALF